MLSASDRFFSLLDPWEVVGAPDGTVSINIRVCYFPPFCLLLVPVVVRKIGHVILKETETKCRLVPLEMLYEEREVAAGGELPVFQCDQKGCHSRLDIIGSRNIFAHFRKSLFIMNNSCSPPGSAASASSSVSSSASSSGGFNSAISAAFRCSAEPEVAV